MGNGMTLGITNGVVDYGLQALLPANSSGTQRTFSGNTSLINKPNGSKVSGGSLPNASVGHGVSTDPTKSGIVANLNGINIGDVNSIKLGKYIIKY